MLSSPHRFTTNAETENSLLIRQNNSLYVKKKARYRSMKHRFLTYIKRVGTEDFQKEIIYNSLATKNRFVKKFIDLALGQKLRLSQINDYHYNLIDDRSILNPDQTTTTTHQTVEIKSKIFLTAITLFTQLQFIPLIYPEKKFTIMWDITASLARLYFLYLIPIQIAWTQQRLLFDTYIVATTIMLIILLIDFFLSLNTVYYESGQLVVNRIKIVKQYISREYGLEWISIFLILIFLLISIRGSGDVNVNENQSYILLLLFLVHLKGVRDKATQYEMALNLQKITAIYMDLIKFVLLIFYAIRIFSCIWFWASEYSYLYFQNSWLATNHDSWQNQYLYSFYFACVTMYTIGYGDITPKSNLEKVVAIMLIMISSIQLSYSINTVGNIIQKISFYTEERKNNLSIINQYMSRKKIPLSLQMQIRDYLTKYWESKNQEKSQEEGSIIKLLSEDLQQQLMIQSNQAIIQQNNFINKNFSHQCQQILLSKINVIHLEPEQYFNINNSLVYVEEGEIELLLPNGPASYKKRIRQGEFGCLRGLILGEQHKSIYRSLNFSKILQLNRAEFISTLKEFSSDYERFCLIKDKLQFNEEYHYLSEKCDSCKSNSHTIENCPLLHLIPERAFLIKKFQFSQPQRRKKFKRAEKRLVRQINQTELNEFLKKYEQDLNIYNVPDKEDIETKIPLPKFKIQQSVSPAQFERFSTENIDQFAGIQRQCSLIASKQMIPLRQDSIQAISSLTISCYKKQREQKNQVLAASVKEQCDNRIIHLKSLKEDFQDEVLDLEILQKKYKNQTESSKYDLQNFDCIHNFNEYYPHNNIDTYKRLSYHKMKRLKLYLKKFMRYLEYPAAFFEKYAYFQINTTDEEIP